MTQLTQCLFAAPRVSAFYWTPFNIDLIPVILTFGKRIDKLEYTNSPVQLLHCSKGTLLHLKGRGSKSRYCSAEKEGRWESQRIVATDFPPRTGDFPAV